MSQRLNKERYAIHGDWVRQRSTAWDPSIPEGVDYWAADLLEKRSGHVWHGGAHRVRIGFDTGGRYKSTTFYGEMAYTDAARLIADADDYRRWHR